MTSLRMILMTSLAGAALFVGNAASAPAAKPAAARPDVEPAAVQALNRMGAFIGTLQTFEVKSDTTEDVVLETGQKLQFTRQVAYRVRRPDGFTIETASDRKVRQFFYDGKQLTVVAPRAGFYATVDAPPTIQGVLDRAWDRYAISLPLEDLFYWGQAQDRSGKLLTAAYDVGFARIGGQDCEQYAFRGPLQDWQIWIKNGPEPVPLKVVITDRSDPVRPEYAAVLNWNLKAKLTAADFTFRPTNAVRPIRMAVR